jgi:O-antigen/teichoic acid export membrane protein
MTSGTTPASAPKAKRLAFLRRATVVAVAMAIMNVAAYGFTLIGTHRLAPEQFGALTALLGLLLIGNVASLGLQAAGARQLATHSGAGAGALSDTMLKAGNRAALVLTAVCLALTPVFMWLLHIDSVVSIVLLAPTLGCLTVMGAQLGVLQGSKRWTELAVIYTLTGVGRLVLGGGALLVRPTLDAAMIGLALGAAVPIIVGRWVLRGSTGATKEQIKTVLREAAFGTHTLLAFFVIANADVLFARALLDGTDSGYYAAGVIIAKACLFLPQFVIVLVFPTLAQSPGDTQRLRKAIAAVAVIGGADKYAPLGPYTWLFAVSGSAYAVLQLVVYAAIAQQEKRAALGIWIGLVVLAVAAGIVLGTGIATGLNGVKVLVAMTSTCALLLSAVLAAGLHRQAAGSPQA